MSWIDWLVLCSTLMAIVIYGLYKSRGQTDTTSYFKGNNSLPWYAVGLSVMATQASAITFLSAPGQAYTDGMRFIQYYFGLPLAMIVICAVFIPLYHKLNVYTAYEFLETRFDLKTRSLTALLFLIQRGLASGLTIYAPAIILSTLLSWDIFYTNLAIGGLVIVYTYFGGSKAVSYTQLAQMSIILIGIFIAAIQILQLLPQHINLSDAVKISGYMGKMNIIDTQLNFNEKYNLWSGILGGFFLSLSYFGTDQSQVGRYISGKSVTEIRYGLLFNGFLKIPMQFFILFIGVLLFSFYTFQKPPIFFNQNLENTLINSSYSSEYQKISQQYDSIFEMKKALTNVWLESQNSDIQIWKEISSCQEKMDLLRLESKSLIAKEDKSKDTNDINYIFLDFVLRYFPVGMIGLLIAVIFSASMSSTSSELNALASTSVVDIYRRSIAKDKTESHYLKASKMGTLIWGIFAISVSNIATKMGSLIEAVNVLGSIFYGTILGVFLVAFFVKYIHGKAVFIAAVIAQLVTILFFYFSQLGFLWYNLLAPSVIIVVGLLLQFIFNMQNLKK